MKDGKCKTSRLMVLLLLYSVRPRGGFVASVLEKLVERYLFVNRGTGNVNKCLGNCIALLVTQEEPCFGG